MLRNCNRVRACLSVGVRSVSSSVLQYTREVKLALKNGDPVVALESTIITHGMPYPENLRTALDVEQVVRNAGAVPATVAVLKGKIHVGLSEQQLEELASSDEHHVKISRRDLPPVIAQKMSGGTTVAGTMIVAHKAGINMFVTGGLGGVHRGAEITMDISADLVELGRTPVTVVSAGIKSILDIEKTLEFLETQGVCVATYGDSKEFPSFWTRKSGFLAPWNVKDPFEAAQLIAARHSWHLDSGVLIANPIPTNHEADGKFIEAAVQDALKEVTIQHVKGNDITPFVLSRVHTATKGASLKSNIALVKNNALVGSLIAKELANMNLDRNAEEASLHRVYFTPSPEKTAPVLNPKRPVVIGGSVVDFNIKLDTDSVENQGGNYPGKVYQGYGGVGRNIADCVTRLGLNPLLISAVGNDLNGKGLIHHNKYMDKSGITVLNDTTTATCCAIHNKPGTLLYIVGDMNIHDRISEEMLLKFEKEINAAPMIIIDGNIPKDTVFTAVEMASRLKKPVWFEPTNIFKTLRAFQKDRVSGITYTSPNFEELVEIYNFVTQGTAKFSGGDVVMEAARMSAEILKAGAVQKTVFATIGPKGVVKVTRKTDGTVEAFHYEAPQPSVIRTVSGAGDCSASAIITGMVNGLDDSEYMSVALELPLVTLSSYFSVPETITKDIFKRPGRATPKRLSI